MDLGIVNSEFKFVLDPSDITVVLSPPDGKNPLKKTLVDQSRAMASLSKTNVEFRVNLNCLHTELHIP